MDRSTLRLIIDPDSIKWKQTRAIRLYKGATLYSIHRYVSLVPTTPSTNPNKGEQTSLIELRSSHIYEMNSRRIRPAQTKIVTCCTRAGCPPCLTRATSQVTLRRGCNYRWHSNGPRTMQFNLGLQRYAGPAYTRHRTPIFPNRRSRNGFQERERERVGGIENSFSLGYK